MNNKIGLALVALVLCLCLCFAGPSSASPGGHYEATTTISTSISSAAAVVPAVSGKVIVVESMLVRSSGAGVVVFTDGSGGTTIANVYLEADKPFVVPSDILGGGLRTTSGNGVYAVLSGATLTGVFRVHYE